MKTFAIHYSEYPGISSSMSTIKAKDLRSLLLLLLDYDDDGETLEELKETFDDGNGDGQQFISVIDVETSEEVLGDV